MQVQVLLSAPSPKKTNLLSSFFYSLFWHRTCDNVVHCRQTMFATCFSCSWRSAYANKFACSAITLVPRYKSCCPHHRLKKRTFWVRFFLFRCCTWKYNPPNVKAKEAISLPLLLRENIDCRIATTHLVILHWLGLSLFNINAKLN